MTLWRPSRRELIGAAPLLLGAAALPKPVGVTGNRNLKLFVLGDWGRDGGHYQKQVAAWMHHEAQNSGCDLVVTTGDNFYTFGVASAQDPQWRTSYENVYSPELRRIPWFPTAGNHDWGGNVWAQLDRTGNAGWHMPWIWYDIPGARFGRPDVHLFFIDTTVWRGKENRVHSLCGQSIREEDMVQQKKWLSDALRASCASTKIVFGHHPIYLATGNRVLDELDAMLIEANVTAYICGHKHSLYHVKSEHLDYICSGGGSEERDVYRGGNFNPRCEREAVCGDPRLERYLERAGFAALEIGEEALSFRFVDRDGRVTPPASIKSKGNHALGCGGPLPIDPALQRERLRPKGKTYFPCASVF